MTDRHDPKDPKRSAPHTGHDADGDAFWSALRMQVAVREQREVLPLEDAEKYLKNCEDVPLEDGAIERMVAQAVAEDDERMGAPPKRGILRAPVSWGMRIAAALLFVVAIPAVVVYVLWSGRDSMDTLSYRGALTILMDTQKPAAIREPAQGRVFSRAYGGILLLREMRDDPVLGAIAEQFLIEFRTLIDAPESFRMVRIDTPFEELKLVVRDPSRDPAARRDAFEQVAEIVRTGILALANVQPGNEVQAESLERFWITLRGELGR